MVEHSQVKCVSPEIVMINERDQSKTESKDAKDQHSFPVAENSKSMLCFDHGNKYSFFKRHRVLKKTKGYPETAFCFAKRSSLLKR